MTTGQDWLSELEKTNDANRKYLSAKVGSEYVLQDITINIDHKAKYPINEETKPYAIRITGTIDDVEKVLSINTVTGEIALRKLGAILKEQGLELEGSTLTFKHPSHSSLMMGAGDIEVKVSFDSNTKKFDIKVKGAPDTAPEPF